MNIWEIFKEKFRKIRWKHFHIPIKAFLMILIPISIVLGAGHYLLYDEAHYQKEFTKVGTYERVPDADDVIESGSLDIGRDSRRDITYVFKKNVKLAPNQTINCETSPALPDPVQRSAHQRSAASGHPAMPGQSQLAVSYHPNRFSAAEFAHHPGAPTPATRGSQSSALAART